jgi:two-component system nitrogen regulation response regulator GlnG
MADIWIVDDEPAICWALQKSLTADGHSVKVFASAETFLQSLRDPATTKPHLLLLDVRLPGASGIDLLRQMTIQHPDVPVIMMTAFGDLRVAVEAIRGKAFEYLTKPFSLDVALQAVSRAIDQAQLDTHAAPPKVEAELRQSPLLGDSLAMRHVYKQIAVAATIDAPVLMEGEPGCGKSLVAAMIHRFGPNPSGPFLHYRPADENGQTIEAELFGIRIVSPSPTVQAGLLQLAAGGTLVLDEVGQLPIKLQSKILTAIESRQFMAVADNQPIELAARLLFTSSHPPDSLVDDGDLLPALQSQLDVYHIQVPALRERKDDIRQLIVAFLAAESNAQPLTITEEAIRSLQSRSWPGNVRELRQAIQYGAVRAKGNVIQAVDLPPTTDPNSLPASIDQPLSDEIKLWTSQKLAQRTPLADLVKDAERIKTPDLADGHLYEDCLAIIDDALISQLMIELDGNRAAIAQQLGIHRSTLRQKMKRYDAKRKPG